MIIDERGVFRRRGMHRCRATLGRMSLVSSKQSRPATHLDRPFNGVKVFSATMVGDRGQLGEKVSDGIARHPERSVTDIVVTQSSDAAFHCIAITVFYNEDARR